MTGRSGIVDCHVHVVDRARHPYRLEDGGYTPGDDEQGRAGELVAIMRRHGVAAALLVQPSCYGGDVGAMRECHARCPEGFRIVAGLPAPAAALPGLVGVRINLVNHDLPGDRLVAALRHCAAHDLWAEIQCPAPRLPSILPMIGASGVKALFDHMGYPDPRRGPDEPGFRALLDLTAQARHAVKLSGAFRISGEAPPHADLDVFAARLIEAFGPQRSVWGSDWPFVGAEARPHYGQTLAQLERWVPDEGMRRQVLCDTPRRLFGFGGRR